jgi:hypothetical protein
MKNKENFELKILQHKIQNLCMNKENRSYVELIDDNIEKGREFKLTDEQIYDFIARLDYLPSQFNEVTTDIILYYLKPFLNQLQNIDCHFGFIGIDDDFSFFGDGRKVAAAERKFIKILEKENSIFAKEVLKRINK